MNHPKEERTLLLIKPDGVRRGLTGEVLRRLEQRGLKIIALQMIKPSAEQMDNHYPKGEEWLKRIGEKTTATFEKYGRDVTKTMGTSDLLEIGQEVRKWLVVYMASAPIVKVIVEGIHAVDMVRKLVGNTFPYQADVGTIRGDFSVDSPIAANLDKRSIFNIAHASENPEEATHEIAHWFTSAELHEYDRSVE